MIVVKASRDRLKDFESDFSHYELYLNKDDDLNQLPDTTMKALSVHIPHGADTEEDLKKYSEYARKIKAQNLIVHLGKFDTSVLDQHNSEDVRICLENTPFYDNLLEELKKAKTNIGAVIDIEHFYQYAKDKGIEDISSYLQKKLLEIKKAGIKPMIHASGDDYTKFDLSLGAGQPSEHLPLNFSGKIKDVFIEDKINHKTWTEIFSPSKAYVTLEIHKRPDYDYEAELLKSKKFLENENPNNT